MRGGLVSLCARAARVPPELPFSEAIAMKLPAPLVLLGLVAPLHAITASSSTSVGGFFLLGRRIVVALCLFVLLIIGSSGGSTEIADVPLIEPGYGWHVCQVLDMRPLAVQKCLHDLLLTWHGADEPARQLVHVQRAHLVSDSQELLS